MRLSENTNYNQYNNSKIKSEVNNQLNNCMYMICNPNKISNELAVLHTYIYIYIQLDGPLQLRLQSFCYSKVFPFTFHFHLL